MSIVLILNIFYRLWQYVPKWNIAFPYLNYTNKNKSLHTPFREAQVTSMPAPEGAGIQQIIFYFANLIVDKA